MGSFTSKKKETPLEGGEVTFDHFQVIRAIGRGSFGKVCIVQKKDSKQMFAMKYMNKAECGKREALNNVFREIEILASVSHPFLVNLWFSFQDAEDMFMVVELLLGGDLRYHLQQGVVFSDEAVRLFVLEVASALTYLHARNIIHRDIKPDNLLLDEEGHVHITDFNIAAVVKAGELATSMSGTKPYMAPEVFACTVDECSGYGTAVDWWSLGVSAYEIKRGKRPFDIHSATSLVEIRRMFASVQRFPAEVHHGLIQLITGLLVVDPSRRITSLEAVHRIPFMAQVNLDSVLSKKIKPAFTPPKDHLNCDPTFELEEMIIESRPLHQKKKRLSKQKSLTHTSQSDAEGEIYGGMLVFNREVEEAKREREKKEREREEREKNWQEELEESMRLSDPTGHGCTFTGSQGSTPVKAKSERGHKEKSGHRVTSPPMTCVIVTSADPGLVTKATVSPTSVRARIAGSPKVKVKGSTVTIESPRSSSSSHTRNSTQYLQERLKELQADQRRSQTKTQGSDVTRSDDVTLNTNQSQHSVENRSASHKTGVNSGQSEHQEESSLANHAEGSKGVAKEEEEEDFSVCLHTTTTTTATPISNNNNNKNNLSNNSNNKEEEKDKRTREEEKKR